MNASISLLLNEAVLGPSIPPSSGVEGGAARRVAHRRCATLQSGHGRPVCNARPERATRVPRRGENFGSVFGVLFVATKSTSPCGGETPLPHAVSRRVATHCDSGGCRNIETKKLGITAQPTKTLSDYAPLIRPTVKMGYCRITLC